MNRRFILIIIIISLVPLCASAAKKSASKHSYFISYIKDTLLHDGVIYQNALIGKSKLKFSAHIIRADLNNFQVRPVILKAENQISGLAKLQEIIRNQDSIDRSTTLGAVNANFWRAYSNNPIGALIVDGVIVEMNPYKEWSGLFLNDRNIPFINNFKIQGKVSFKNGISLEISCVNRRRDSTLTVLYNKFAGDHIPYINEKSIDKLINIALLEKAIAETFNDSTESEFDIELYRQELIENQRAQMIENSLYKIKMEYLDKPAVNIKNNLRVIAIDTGKVAINDNQVVLSVGINFPHDRFPKIGDTVSLEFETNFEREQMFMNAVTGTPRLVRNGLAKHEAIQEGSKGKRFINRQLGRTAIGYNKSKNELIIVAIDHPNRGRAIKGASLTEAANIMKALGCSEAMNLDGGGSTIMVINGKNVLSPERPDASRKINAGVGVKLNY